jgi:YbbR domain-containing protein
MGRFTANLGYKLLALVIAVFLWGVAHGSSSIERGFDVPVALRGVPADLVITGQSADAVNVRVMGSRAALRNLEPETLEYTLDVSSAKPGVSEFEVDASLLEFPRGAKIVARSPSRIEIRFEARGTKALRVRPELTGEPAAGYEVTAVEVEPTRLRASGARSELARLVDVATDAIDVSGASASFERDVRVQVGGTHVRLDEATEVKVRVQIAAKPAPPAPPAPPRARPGRRG